MTEQAVVHFRNIARRFLAGLALADVKTIISAARERRYLANSVIVTQGHPADHFFLLVNGRARYFYSTVDGRKLNLRWLTPGDIFAPAALLSRPSEYLVSAEAVKNTLVLVWDRSAIRNLTRQYPQLLDNTLPITLDYLAFYRDAHTSLTCDTAPHRVAHVLANLASSIGHRVAEGTELDVRNEELANEANVTPSTVSRLLSDWQRKGILTKSRGRILLSSPERLFLEKD